MGDEFNTVYQIFDTLGTLGILIFIIVAMFKGWVVPITVLNKIDKERKDNSDKLDAERKEHVLEITKANKDLRDVLTHRIEDLTKLLDEREARVERGVQLLGTYTQAQDVLSQIAEHLQHGNTQ